MSGAAADKATELVCNEITSACKRSRFMQSIYAVPLAGKSVGMLHNSHAATTPDNLTGGFSATPATTHRAQIMSHVVGSMEAHEQQTAWPNVIENMNWCSVGCNLMVTLKNSWKRTRSERRL